VTLREDGGAEGEGANDRGADLAELGVVTVGDLLSTSARAVGARFPQFVGIALVVMLPAIVLSVGANEWLHAARQRMTEDPDAVGVLGQLAAAGFGLGVVALQLVLQFLAQAALMYATVEHMAGRRAGVGQALAGGFASAGTVIALAVLNTIAIALATFACVLPGVILTCVLFVSVPAAVTERLGPIEAMQRSAELTAGHRLTIFLALLVLALVWGSFACFGGMGFTLAGGPGAASLSSSLALRVAGYAVQWGLSLFIAIRQAALAAVFNARVRGIRDRLDVDEIARLFE
jgi:hypothetical protein